MKPNKAKLGNVKVSARGRRPSNGSDTSDDSYSDSYSDSDQTSGSSDCSGSYTSSSDFKGSRRKLSSPQSYFSSTSSSEDPSSVPVKRVQPSKPHCSTINQRSARHRPITKKSPLPKSQVSSTLKAASKMGATNGKNASKNRIKGNDTNKTTKSEKKKDGKHIPVTAKPKNTNISTLKRTGEENHKIAKMKRTSSTASSSRSGGGPTTTSSEAKTGRPAGSKSKCKKRKSSKSNPGSRKIKPTATKCSTKCSSTGGSNRPC